MSTVGETGLALQELIKDITWAFHWPRSEDVEEQHTQLLARSQHGHRGLSFTEQPSHDALQAIGPHMLLTY